LGNGLTDGRGDAAWLGDADGRGDAEADGDAGRLAVALRVAVRRAGTVVAADVATVGEALGRVAEGADVEQATRAAEVTNVKVPQPRAASAARSVARSRIRRLLIGAAKSPHPQR